MLNQINFNTLRMHYIFLLLLNVPYYLVINTLENE